MSAINPSWPKFIFASVAKHIKESFAAGGLPVRVDFLDKRDSSWMGQDVKAEVTITGPMTKEISNKLHRIWVDVFVVITSNVRSNGYTHLEKCGIAAETLDQCIVCKDYGATGLVELGIISPRPEAGETVKITNLKPMEKDTQNHSTVQCRYLGYFIEG